MVFSSPIYMKLLSQSSFKTVIILFIHIRYCADNFVFLIVDYIFIEITGHIFVLFLFKKKMLYIRIHGVKNGIKMLKKT